VTAVTMNTALIDGAKRRQSLVDTKDCKREHRRPRCAWMWNEHGDDWPKLITQGIGA